MKAKKITLLLLALTALAFVGCKQPNSGGTGDGNVTPSDSIVLHAVDNQLPPSGTTTIEVSGSVTPRAVMSSNPSVIAVELTDDGKTILATAGDAEGSAIITASNEDIISDPIELKVIIGPDYQLEFIDTSATVKEKRLDEKVLKLRIGDDVGTVTAIVADSSIAEAVVNQSAKTVTIKGIDVGTTTVTLTDGANNSTNSAAITVNKADITLKLEQLKNPIGVGNTRVLNITRGNDLGTGAITVASSDNSVKAEIKGETVVVTGVSENTATPATITITHTATGAEATATVTIDEAYTFVFKVKKPSDGTINSDGTEVTGTMSYMEFTLTYGSKIIQSPAPNNFTMVGSSFATSITWSSAGANVSVDTSQKGTYVVHAIDKNGVESNEITVTVQ